MFAEWEQAFVHLDFVWHDSQRRDGRKQKTLLVSATRTMYARTVHLLYKHNQQYCRSVSD